jgi:hypothetical protein
MNNARGLREDHSAPQPQTAAIFVRWRPSVPRFALSVLLGSGALCLAGVSGAPASARSEPLLGLAVNAVAVLHYWFILKIRSNPSGRAYEDEFYVDELRHSDWACTLFFLYLHFHAAAARLGAPHPPLFSGFAGALLQPLLVLLGALGRFLSDELRARDWRRWAGVAAYLLSCTVFGIALYNLLSCLLRVPESTAHEPRAGDSARLLVGLALAQLGYPLLALLQVCWRACVGPEPLTHERLPLMGWGVSRGASLKATVPLRAPAAASYPEWLSVIKDVGFAVLDVTVKGGVALYSGLLG